MKARWGLAQQHFGQSESALFSHPKQALAATSLPLVGSQARDSRALFSWLVWVGSPGSGPGFPPGKRTAVFMDLPARLHRPGVWALHGSLLLPMCDSPPSQEMCPGPPTTASLSCLQLPLASYSCM